MTKVNCAVYVRKSTEKGLELEFNSLHNQEDAAEVTSCRKPLITGNISKPTPMAAYPAAPWNVRL